MPPKAKTKNTVMAKQGRTTIVVEVGEGDVYAELAQKVVDVLRQVYRREDVSASALSLATMDEQGKFSVLDKDKKVQVSRDGQVVAYRIEGEADFGFEPAQLE